ncbi:MAG: HNH endonuclease family protein [Candidatus Microsaccharimonas sp.]
MKRRRALLVLIGGTILLVLLAGAMPKMIQESPPLDISLPWQTNQPSEPAQPGSALEALNKLEVKGRAAKTGYARSQFGSGWSTVNGCDTRDIILYRDLINTSLSDECTVTSGILNDTYTGQVIEFSRADASKVQIDHVVALSDAWQTGAQQLTAKQRQQLANDPLELIAVSGKANQAKSDSDAASWLPSNKSFRCKYVARQITVKQKYSLWVTAAEKEAMQKVLSGCASEPLTTS